MKVAFVTPHLSRASGGVMTGVAPLVAELCRMGMGADIYGIEDPLAPEEARAWGDAVVACPSRGPRRFGFAPTLVPRLCSARPDVLDVQGLWMFPSAASLHVSRKLGCPRVVSPHGMLDPWAVRKSAWKKRLALWLFEGEHLHGAAAIRALNASELAAVRAFGLRNPIAVVPYGIDLPVSSSEPRSPGPRTLLFLSRIDPKKGVHELIEGWQLSGAAAQGWRLQIVGWGDERYVRRTRILIGELGLQRSVELSGPSFGEAKDRVFREANAFILPSYSEGLPMAILEAWSYALPVLMTGACNVPEGFARGAALEIGTEPVRIADGIRTLVTMSDREREAMGLAGRALVEEKFTWEQVARHMIELYQWVLGGGSPPTCVVMD